MLCQGIRSSEHELAASAASIEQICLQLEKLQDIDWDDEAKRGEALKQFAGLWLELQSVLKLLHSGIATTRQLQPIIKASAEGVASRGCEAVEEGELSTRFSKDFYGALMLQHASTSLFPLNLHCRLNPEQICSRAGQFVGPCTALEPQLELLSRSCLCTAFALMRIQPAQVESL